MPSDGFMSAAARRQRAFLLSEELHRGVWGLLVILLLVAFHGTVVYFGEGTGATRWFFGAMLLLSLYALGEAGYTFFLAWRLARARKRRIDAVLRRRGADPGAG